MHFRSTHNEDKVFYTLEELIAAQTAAKASGDPVAISEVFDLTWVDSTATNNFS